MKADLPCCIVRDLLPTYVDGLTGEETSRAVRDHTARCAGCRAALEEMRAPAAGTDTAGETAPEVDYLKKVRRAGNKRSFINGAVIAAVIVGLLLTSALVWRLRPRTLTELGFTEDVSALKACLNVAGDYSDFRYELPLDSGGEHYHALLDLLSSLQVRPSFRNLLYPVDSLSSSKAYNGRSVDLFLYGTAETGRILSLIFLDSNTLGVQISGQDGVKLFHPVHSEDFAALESYVWDNGEYIGTDAVELASLACEFTGQPDAVKAVIRTFYWAQYFGPYTNAVSPENEWTVTVSEPLDPLLESGLLHRMEQDSFTLLGLVGDLQSVTWRYACGGEAKEAVYTAADATARVAGYRRLAADGSVTVYNDIKSFVNFNYPADPIAVQNLMDAIAGIAAR